MRRSDFINTNIDTGNWEVRFRSPDSSFDPERVKIYELGRYDFENSTISHEEMMRAIMPSREFGQRIFVVCQPPSLNMRQNGSHRVTIAGYWDHEA